VYSLCSVVNSGSFSGQTTCRTRHHKAWKWGRRTAGGGAPAYSRLCAHGLAARKATAEATALMSFGRHKPARMPALRPRPRGIRVSSVARLHFRVRSVFLGCWLDSAGSPWDWYAHEGVGGDALGSLAGGAAMSADSWANADLPQDTGAEERLTCADRRLTLGHHGPRAEATQRCCAAGRSGPQSVPTLADQCCSFTNQARRRAEGRRSARAAE